MKIFLIAITVIYSTVIFAEPLSKSKSYKFAEPGALLSFRFGDTEKNLDQDQKMELLQLDRQKGEFVRAGILNPTAFDKESSDSYRLKVLLIASAVRNQLVNMGYQAPTEQGWRLNDIKSRKARFAAYDVAVHSLKILVDPSISDKEAAIRLDKLITDSQVFTPSFLSSQNRPPENTARYQSSSGSVS